MFAPLAFACALMAGYVSPSHCWTRAGSCCHAWYSGFCAEKPSNFITRRTDSNDNDFPNSRLISSRNSDSVHRPNSNLNCCGVLSFTARAIHCISSALIFGGRPGIGFASKAFWPPSANFASQSYTRADVQTKRLGHVRYNLPFAHSLHCLLAQYLKRVVIQFAAVRSSFAFHSGSIQEMGLLSRRLVTVRLTQYFTFSNAGQPHHGVAGIPFVCAAAPQKASLVQSSIGRFPLRLNIFSGG